MRHGSLFSGIGGFDLAAEWMGWENVFHCEWMPFPRQVLKYHFPNSISYEDITKTDFTIHRGTIDILTGGFPCQPYSQAGKRLGKNDSRHLWPQMFRAIQEIEPQFVVGENVVGISNWNGGLVFEEICNDMENIGYQIQPVLLPACSIGAPHRRDRIFFVATNTNCIRFKDSQKENEIETNKTWINAFHDIEPDDWGRFPTESLICGRNDGIPEELDNITFPKWRKKSIESFGNAVVPQLAYQIFKAIVDVECNKLQPQTT